MSWITTLYFCELNGPNNKEGLLPNLGALRKPARNEVWWPQNLGSEIENLGNLVVLKQIPTTLHLGIHIVAFGFGIETLKIQVSKDGAKEDAALIDYKKKIKFDTVLPESVPGTASIKAPVTNLKVEQPGLYWFSVLIGRSHPSRLPLYVVQREDLVVKE